MIKFLRSIFYTYLAQAVCLLLTLLTNIVVTRLLGPSGKGIITLTTNYILILVTISSFGISEGIVYFIGSKKYKINHIFSSIIFCTIITTIIIIVISLLFRNWLIVTFLKDIGIKNYYIALLIFPTFYFFLFIRKTLLGGKDIKIYNLIFVLQAGLVLASSIILIPIWGVKGGITAFIISFLVTGFIGMFHFLKKYGAPTVQLNLKFIFDSFLYGVKSQIGIILNFFDRRFDIFIINIYLNPTYVGLYAIAVALAELPWRLSDAIGTVLFPEVAGMKKENAIKLVTSISRNSIFMTIILCLLLLIFGKPIIVLLFGVRFLPSLPALHLLLPGVIALGMNRVLCSGFSGLGKPEYGTYTVISSAIATIVLDIIFIPKYGIVGASLASSIAYMISAVAAVIIFLKLSKINILELLIITRSDLSKYPTFIEQIFRRKT